MNIYIAVIRSIEEPNGAIRSVFNRRTPPTKAPQRGLTEHYDALFNLGLTPKQKQDLVEYLKSI